MTAAIVIALLFAAFHFVLIATDATLAIGQLMRDRRRRRADLELPRAIWRRR